MQTQVHLIKLCVGADEPSDLSDWHRRYMAETGQPNPVHVTRMWPRRADELIGGGSLYWVMRGLIRARQPILALERVEGEDGIARCAIHLGQDLVLTQPAPRRPFQGWRYLSGSDAPPDLRGAAPDEIPLPTGMQIALGDIGVR